MKPTSALVKFTRLGNTCGIAGGRACYKLRSISAAGLPRRQNSLDCRGLAIDDREQNPRRSFGLTAALLPVSQGRSAYPELFGEIVLRHTELPPDPLDIDSRRHKDPVGASLAEVTFGISHGVLKGLDDLRPNGACFLSACAISFFHTWTSRWTPSS